MSGFFVNNIAEKVVEACRENDSSAQSQLFQAFAPAVFSLAFRLTASRPLADEVVQDTFLEVLTKIDQFRGDAPIGAWVRRIAVNKALAQLRSPWHKRGESLVPERCEGVAMDDSVSLDLHKSLIKLSPTARSVLWLHEVEGYTHKEIATLMGKSQSFSKSQLSRAHQKLKQWAAADLARQNGVSCDHPPRSNRDERLASPESSNTLEQAEPCMPLLNS